MNKDFWIRLLTGAIAAGIRRVIQLAAVGLASTSAKIVTHPDGSSVLNSDGTAVITVDPTTLATAAATLIVPWLWSIWEKRLKTKESAQAVMAVAGGVTPSEALSHTTTLKKVQEEVDKTVITPKP